MTKSKKPLKKQYILTHKKKIKCLHGGKKTHEEKDKWQIGKMFTTQITDKGLLFVTYKELLKKLERSTIQKNQGQKI